MAESCPTYIPRKNKNSVCLCPGMGNGDPISISQKPLFSGPICGSSISRNGSSPTNGREGASIRNLRIDDVVEKIRAQEGSEMPRDKRTKDVNRVGLLLIFFKATHALFKPPGMFDTLTVPQIIHATKKLTYALHERNRSAVALGPLRPTVFPLRFGLFSFIFVKTMGYLSPYLE